MVRSYPFYSWISSDSMNNKTHGGKDFIDFKINYGTSAKNTHEAIKLQIRNKETDQKLGDQNKPIIDIDLKQDIETHIGTKQQKAILTIKNNIPCIKTRKGDIPISSLIANYLQEVDQQ